MKKEELEKEAIDIINKLGTEEQIKEYKVLVDINEKHYNGLTSDFYNKGFYIFIGEPFKFSFENIYRVELIYLVIKPITKGSSSNLICTSGSWYIKDVFTEEYLKSSGILRQTKLNTLLS